MEQVLLDDHEKELFLHRVSSLGYEEVASRLRVSRGFVYRLVKDPFRPVRLLGKRQLMLNLIEGNKHCLEVDAFGNSSVSAIPRELAIIEVIDESLNKMNEEQLKKVLKFVISLE